MKSDLLLRFFVFRHGETDWNSLRRFQGHTDIPLNSKGESQARALAEKIKKLQLKVILSSDLQRAQQTAQLAIEGLQIPVFLHPELRETHMGEAEGLTQEEIHLKFGEDCLPRWRSLDQEHAHYSFPGGESKFAHLERVRQVLEKYAHEKNHQNGDQIGVSTHGGSLVRLVHAAEGAPAQAVPIPNCALYELQYDVNQRKWIFVGEV